MYKRKTEGILEYADFVLLEMLCINISYVLAYCLRHGWHILPYENSEYLFLAGIISLLDFAIMALFDPFERVLKRRPYREFLASFRHVALVFAALTLYLFLVQESATYSRISICLTFLFDFVIGYIVRMLYSRTRCARKNHQRSLLVISDEMDVEKVISSIREDDDNGLIICGVCLTDAEDITEKKEIAGIPIACSIKNVSTYVCREWVDEVFIRTDNDEHFESVMRDIEETGVTIHISVEKHASVTVRKQMVEKIGSMPVVTSSINSASSGQLLLKRLIDIIGGFIGCIFTLIVGIIIAPFILTKSPGPLFFVQERIGQNGKRFKMIKFRSMIMDAEKKKAELKAQNTMSGDMMFKLDFDPRIIGNRILPDGTKKTGIGEFIRATSIDEFPQFFNVLKGDMSLVGTRPPTPDEWNRYELHHRARLCVRPGITGLWQVSGRSDITDFEEVVKLDTDYINNWSLGMDVQILLRTVGVVFKRKGAK